MLRRCILAAAALSLLTLSSVSAVLAQSNSPGSDADRRERIAENLKLQFEQLREAQVAVTELSESDLPGFDEGTIVINSRNTVRFLVTRDDTHFYLLAANAIDVSMTKEEVAVEFQRLAREESAAARQRHKELLALSQGMPARGNKNAPVTIVEFSDFQCPYCARVLPTVEQVLEKYPDNVRLVFMHLPLSMHPWAEPAAIAATCASRQSPEAFWTLHDFYFENQSTVSTENVVDLSRAQLTDSGVDLDIWNQCASDTDATSYQEVLSEVRSSISTATKYGATGTPAFFVNGRFISGAQPLSAFDELIEEALKEDA